MSNIHSFYHSILNIKNIDEEQTIKSIVAEEKEKLSQTVDSLEGLCIYIASRVEERLREKGITTYKIDLNDIVGYNHISLIAEYKYDSQIKRYLIDPTFEQFKKIEGRLLHKLSTWPSEKIKDISFLNLLLTIGVAEINDETFNEYINAFRKNPEYINLDDYLLNQRMDYKR